MLSVWPEIIRISHWLDNVTFNFVNENFIFKSIMIGVMNKVFINSSQKIKVSNFIPFLKHKLVKYTTYFWILCAFIIWFSFNN